MRSHMASSAAGLAVLAVLVTACGSSSGPGGASGTTATTGAPPASGGAGTSAPASPGGTRAPSAPAAPHATEFNPPGDIPDNAVFVDHVAPRSRVHFTVPEGWARSTSAGVVTFTDKYNSVSVEVRARGSAPTVTSARKQDVAQLRRSVPHFAAGSVDLVSRQYGRAVHITYLLDSAPNPVTDKVVRDAAERFEFWHAGQEAILTLTGPQHADNVDPWRIVSDSLRWR